MEIDLSLEEHRPIGPRDCRSCRHYRRGQESWEMPHIWWHECLKRPSVENLTSFPFKNTKCPHWEKP